MRKASPTVASFVGKSSKIYSCDIDSITCVATEYFPVQNSDSAEGLRSGIPGSDRTQKTPTEVIHAMLASCSCEYVHRMKKCSDATTIIELLLMT